MLLALLVFVQRDRDNSHPSWRDFVCSCSSWSQLWLQMMTMIGCRGTTDTNDEQLMTLLHLHHQPINKLTGVVNRQHISLLIGYSWPLTVESAWQFRRSSSLELPVRRHIVLMIAINVGSWQNYAFILCIMYLWLNVSSRDGWTNAHSLVHLFLSCVFYERDNRLTWQNQEYLN